MGLDKLGQDMGIIGNLPSSSHASNIDIIRCATHLQNFIGSVGNGCKEFYLTTCFIAYIGAV